LRISLFLFDPAIVGEVRQASSGQLLSTKKAGYYRRFVGSEQF
jgi:hypothetical protein